MRVVGFTFIRNGVKFDYPFLESIQSLLPLCDEVVVAVGKSDDDTLELIQALNNPKISILETIWDESLREGGRVLAEETNKAFDAINNADWCFYLQGDEVLHENDYSTIKQTLLQYKDDTTVEGFVFNYLHFYGSYDFVGDSRKWYRKEIRVIRNDKMIRSYRDAQGFRKQDKKLNVKVIDATIYHYGWVKHPKYQQLKQQNFNKLWHDDQWVEQRFGNEDAFDYSQIDSLKRFEGSHPSAISKRIQSLNWEFSFDPTQKKMSFKNKLLHFIESMTGYRIGEYKNYELMK